MSYAPGTILFDSDHNYYIVDDSGNILNPTGLKHVEDDLDVLYTCGPETNNYRQLLDLFREDVTSIIKRIEDLIRVKNFIDSL